MTPRRMQGGIRGAEIGGLAVGLLIILLYALPDVLARMHGAKTGIPWPLIIGVGIALPSLLGAMTAGKIWLKAIELIGRALTRMTP